MDRVGRRVAVGVELRAALVGFALGNAIGDDVAVVDGPLVDGRNGDLSRDVARWRGLDLGIEDVQICINVDVGRVVTVDHPQCLPWFQAYVAARQLDRVINAGRQTAIKGDLRRIKQLIGRVFEIGVGRRQRCDVFEFNRLGDIAISRFCRRVFNRADSGFIDHIPGRRRPRAGTQIKPDRAVATAAGQNARHEAGALHRLFQRADNGAGVTG